MTKFTTKIGHIKEMGDTGASEKTPDKAFLDSESIDVLIHPQKYVVVALMNGGCSYE